MKSIDTLPSYIKRVDDGQILVLSENGLYYLKMMVDEYSAHLLQGWTPECIFSYGDAFEAVEDDNWGPRTSYNDKKL